MYDAVLPEPQRHVGCYDPLNTYRQLRDAGLLGGCSYLHISPDGAEIGWNPIDRLRVDGGDDRRGIQWRSRLKAFSQEASRHGRKAVGYVSFAATDGRAFSVPDWSMDLPLIEFIIPGELVTFDRSGASHLSASGSDVSRHLGTPPSSEGMRRVTGQTPTPFTQLSDTDFMSKVERATEAMKRGEAKKVVLSRYQAYEVDYDPIDLFAAYCMSQQFVDAFLIHFDDVVAIVASPELLVDVRSGSLTANPLAGTRRRGATPEEDEQLRQDLLGDRKELAEHVLSVTTMLAELGPLCDPNTLAVTKLLDVCMQRKVQHLSSVLVGRLSEESRALDAFEAVFPAVTVTGLPRNAATAIIRRLEDAPRGIYAGAVGWTSGDRDCRFSLAIRSIFRYGRTTFLHAGAGIMPESRPEAELAETKHKMSAQEAGLAQVVEAAR